MFVIFVARVMLNLFMMKGSIFVVGGVVVDFLVDFVDCHCDVGLYEAMCRFSFMFKFVGEDA